MVRGILMLILACVALSTTSVSAKPTPDFVNAVDGAGVYQLGGFGGAAPLTLAYSNNGDSLQRYKVAPSIGTQQIGGNLRFALPVPSVKNDELDNPVSPVNKQLPSNPLSTFINQVLLPLLNAINNNQQSNNNNNLPSSVPNGPTKVVFAVISDNNNNGATKNPTENYNPAGNTGDVNDLQVKQGPHVQMYTSAITPHVSGGELQTANEIIPDTLDDAAAINAKGMNILPFGQRLGVVYIVPNGRVSKSVKGDEEEFTGSTSTEHSLLSSESIE